MSEFTTANRVTALSVMGCYGTKLTPERIEQRWANVIGKDRSNFPATFFRPGTFDRSIEAEKATRDAQMHKDLYRKLTSNYFQHGTSPYWVKEQGNDFYVSAVTLNDSKCLSCHTSAKKGDAVALMVYCIQKSAVK